MTSVIQMIISEENFPQIFKFAEKNSALAKNLYNAALFRIRQVFTGWDKTNRTELEQSVFDEIENTKAACKSFFLPKSFIIYIIKKNPCCKQQP